MTWKVRVMDSNTNSNMRVLRHHWGIFHWMLLASKLNKIGPMGMKYRPCMLEMVFSPTSAQLRYMVTEKANNTAKQEMSMVPRCAMLIFLGGAEPVTATKHRKPQAKW